MCTQQWLQQVRSDPELCVVGKAFAVTIAQTESVSNLRNKLTAALKPPAGQELQVCMALLGAEPEALELSVVLVCWA